MLLKTKIILAESPMMFDREWMPFCMYTHLLQEKNIIIYNFSN